MPAVMAEIAKVESPASLALQWIILTTVRPREGADASWNEFPSDGNKPLWSIPAPRMKTRKAFQVPLSPAALDILDRAKQLFRIEGNDLVFPSPRRQKGIARQNITDELRRATSVVCKPHPGHLPGQDREGNWYNVHGCRSSFRTWAEEHGNALFEVRELCLAHDRKGIERIYTQTDLLDLQRKLKDAWAQFIVPPTGKNIRMFPTRRAS